MWLLRLSTLLVYLSKDTRLIPCEAQTAPLAMAKGTSSRIRRYKVVSWLGFTGLVAVSFPLGPFGWTFGGILTAFWLFGRDNGLRRLEIEEGVGAGQRMVDLAVAHIERVADARNWIVAHDMRDSVGCKTCGCPIGRIHIENVQVCYSFRDTMPHNPNDEPPEVNELEWAWFKRHGFEPPPADWPAGKLYFHPYAGDPNFIEIATARGQKYWMEHENSIWDAGLAEPPAWYVDKVVKNSV